MLWLQPILAGSFLGLQVPNGPPTVDEVPSQRPLARRVLIPTWDLWSRFCQTPPLFWSKTAPTALF